MSLEDNKSVAMAWVDASVRGDGAGLRALFAPDARILIVGEMAYCGWMDVDEFFRRTGFLPLAGPVTLKIGAVTAEEDRVWFEAESHAVLRDGGTYDNVYVFAFRIQGGKVVELKEFSDTHHSWRVVDDPVVRGPTKLRERTFETASRVFGPGG